MAHITYRRKGECGQIIINGVDFSSEIYRGPELVEVGDDPESAEVGFRVTFAVGRLDLDAETDIQVTDQFRDVAQRVRSIEKAILAEQSGARKVRR